MSIPGSVGHLALSLALLCACGDSSQNSNCDPDPPCDLSGSVDIPIAFGIGGTYEVSVDTDLGSAAFACTVTSAGAVEDCMQTERTGLDGWTVELTASAPDAPRALVLEIDRGDDESPGPHSLSVQVRSPNGFQVKSIGRNRHVVAADGQTCEACWYELPESI